MNAYRPALLAAQVRAALTVKRWYPDGPVHVYVAIANGERRELDPDVAEALLALLDELTPATLTRAA